jgi:hypothetical protein
VFKLGKKKTSLDLGCELWNEFICLLCTVAMDYVHVDHME